MEVKNRFRALKLCSIFIIVSLNFNVIFNAQGQNQWVTKSYGSLKYSFPKNWTELDFLEMGRNKSYGAQYWEISKTAQFSVIEAPNDIGKSDAHELTDDEIKNLILHLFSPTSKFEDVENRRIANRNAKYVKASARSSTGLELSSINYLLFFKDDLIIVQGIYTTKDEVDLFPILQRIIEGISANK
jgi:hypothetical protein